MIVTDCAAAELLAQDMARGKRPLAVTVGPSRIGDGPADDLEGRHGDQATFPHAKVIGRDRAHACGRLIERPWKSDPFISTLLEAGFFVQQLIVQFFMFMWSHTRSVRQPSQMPTACAKKFGIVTLTPAGWRWKSAKAIGLWVQCLLLPNIGSAAIRCPWAVFACTCLKC